MELSFIRGLYDVPGPFASVFLDATHDSEPARTALKIRWKNLRATLSEQGIDEGSLRSLDHELTGPGALRGRDHPFEESPHPGRHGLALYAAHGDVQYVEITSEPPPTDRAEVSPVPRIAPLLGQRREQLTWLRVVVNRVGADIDDAADTRIQAEGTHLYPIRKSHGGGWSQEHLHRKAEDRWLHNAAEVAVAVDRLAESVEAELLIIAGDIRARRLLIDRLPERWAGRVVEVEAGSRAPGADPTAVEEATRVAVASAVADRRAAALDRFTVNGGEYGASGLPALVTAFARGQVDTLLIDPDELSHTKLWLGLDRPSVARREEVLRRWGAEHVERVPAEEALIRTATATDADVLLVSRDDVRLDDGIGAVLRYADVATNHH